MMILWNNHYVKLIWVVLPLIVFSICGISQSFAEEKISVHVDGGQLLNIVHIDDLGSMNFEIDMQNQGSVTIELPKSVWHIADSECKPTSPIILVDGKEATFTEHFDKDKRILTISAVKDSKIIELIVTGPSAPHTTSLMYGQFCLLQEQKIFPSPKKQMDLGFMLYDVQCRDMLIKIIKNSNNSPLCVYPKTAEKLIEREWGVKFLLEKDKDPKTPFELDKKYTLQVNDSIFEVRYSVIGSQLQEITVDPASLSIIVNLENSEKGHFTIEIPRKLLDAQSGPDGTGVDVDFFVLVNGSEVDFEESSDQFQRTLMIPLEEGASQIEIIGTIP